MKAGLFLVKNNITEKTYIVSVNGTEPFLRISNIVSTTDFVNGKLNIDEEEKKAYENKCILEDAIEDAKENGYSSGYDSGKSDGISNEKINIAKNLLSMNMTLEDISKATCLTIDEIKKIK